MLRKDEEVIAIDRAAFNQGKNALYDFSIEVGGVAQTIVARGPGAVCYKTQSVHCAQEITKGSETNLSRKEK